ncbi:hypothetical protein F4604DRAFT_1719003 [Suillus subluteus]|nr:hypothetical protein F4604DRAFT_1719003 [Suillus subluteus]
MSLLRTHAYSLLQDHPFIPSTPKTCLCTGSFLSSCLKILTLGLRWGIPRRVSSNTCDLFFPQRSVHLIFDFTDSWLNCFWFSHSPIPYQIRLHHHSDASDSCLHGFQNVCRRIQLNENHLKLTRTVVIDEEISALRVIFQVAKHLKGASSSRYQNDGANGSTLLIDFSLLPPASKPTSRNNVTPLSSRFSRSQPQRLNLPISIVWMSASTTVTSNLGRTSRIS